MVQAKETGSDRINGRQKTLLYCKLHRGCKLITNCLSEQPAINAIIDAMLCYVPAYRPMGARAAIGILRLRYYLQLQAGNLAKPAGPTELARKSRR
jgi:hypothetical protein